MPQGRPCAYWEQAKDKKQNTKGDKNNKKYLKKIYFTKKRSNLQTKYTEKENCILIKL